MIDYAALTANLLAFPEQIQVVDANPRWFGDGVFSSIIQAVKMKNGEQTRMEDIARTMNEDRDAFNKIKIEELELLRDSNDHNKGFFEMMIPSVEYDWLTNQINSLTAAHSRDPKDKYLVRLVEYKERRDAITKSKDNGQLQEVAEHLAKMLRGDIKPHFIKTFDQYDNAFGGGLQNNRLYIIGARPSVGKSAMAANIALQALKHNPEMRVDFFTLESTKEQTVHRFLSNMIPLNSKLINNPSRLNEHQKSLITDRLNRLMRMDLRIYDHEYQNKNAIVNKIRQRVKLFRNHHANIENYLAIIDYAGLVEVNDHRKSDVERINEITRDFKLLANELHIPIVLLAQINRTGAQRQTPTLSDLKGSGSLEQDADVVIMMYREDENDPASVSVKIAKNRDGEIGDLKFQFIPEYSKFTTGGK
ncbi:DnaB-like helicase C-terminal domain-containing protein [Enterococcus dispar]|uniref:DnaB-like helicase C-terminal domain-containing protein n=1 Tax=Enterococcus dispar TaxID=44009 RepID=UPI002491F70F|nr:DnaB-like helicase C-terminal domain-containing protein [Enterococcus dispar]